MRVPKIIFIVFFTLAVHTVRSQTMRYFEFSVDCGHGKWQDTSFIAAASDPEVIDTVLANLSRPKDQRKFISGAIDYGNNGVNHNASHWFLWHFIPNKWTLTDMSIEIYDGCPNSDLDADTAYWIGKLGHFAPWSGIPAREVSKPTGINDVNRKNEMLIYPNPVKDELILDINDGNPATVILLNSTGQPIIVYENWKNKQSINIRQLMPGIYFLKIIRDNHSQIEKIIIDK